MSLVRHAPLGAVALSLIACGHLAPPPKPANAPVEPWRPGVEVCALGAPSQVELGQPVPVAFRLDNLSDYFSRAQTIWLLAVDTPLRGVQADIFTVRRDGAPVAYRGPATELPDFEGCPTRGCLLEETEYVPVPRETSILVTVDLAAAYAFDRPGTYTIAWKGLVHDVPMPWYRPFLEFDHGSKVLITYRLHKRRLHPVQFTCAPVTITIVPRRAGGPTGTAPVPNPG